MCQYLYSGFLHFYKGYGLAFKKQERKCQYLYSGFLHFYWGRSWKRRWRMAVSIPLFRFPSFLQRSGLWSTQKKEVCQYLYSGFLHFYEAGNNYESSKKHCVNTFIQVSFISTESLKIPKISTIECQYLYSGFPHFSGILSKPAKTKDFISLFCK